VSDAVPPPFSLEIRTDRDRILLTVDGEIDMSTVERLRAAVREARAAGWDRLVIDLASVRFIDSQGLHLLLDVDREASADGWQFAIIDGSPSVTRLLELTGLNDRFRREDR
jgi:anti-sigma B factor antagonist